VIIQTLLTDCLNMDSVDEQVRCMCEFIKS
jgi:hypothetical protein